MTDVLCKADALPQNYSPDDDFMEKFKQSCQEVYSTIGPGHTEAIYQKALEHECHLQRILLQSQVHIPVVYKQHQIGVVRLDLQTVMPSGKILIVELKSVVSKLSYFESQYLKYKSIIPNSVLLVINFGPNKIEFYEK